MHDRAAPPVGPLPGFIAAAPSMGAARRFAVRPGRCAPVAALLLALLLGACASGPRTGGGDGPPSDPPRGLERTPDAVPRIEPLRSGGPNKPYRVLGRNYTPEARDVPMREQGLASWYGRKFHGRRTANGEVYDMYAMTAAHKTMPLPSYARVRNPSNGAEIVVRVNDRGPFVQGRVIDLSYAAARKLGVDGVAPVEVERLTFEAIRTGEWRRPTRVAPGDITSGGAVAAAPTTVSPPPAQTQPAVSMPSPSAAPATPAAEMVQRAAEPTASADTHGFWVQLGAFRERGGAEEFQQRVSADLDWLAPLMAVFSDAPLFRLQAGPYASLDDARGAAERVREALRLVPVIVERR
ncbi:septal ring lytic transglycosylase RlpA family protein [Methylibium sp.]|uniref:septal ring lytic transglycosylase RlpA family protein n=1 Tax=Methylibium sp. TaxID=2067992 RepID=UPI00345B9985